MKITSSNQRIKEPYYRSFKLSSEKNVEFAFFPDAWLFVVVFTQG